MIHSFLISIMALFICAYSCKSIEHENQNTRSQDAEASSLATPQAAASVNPSQTSPAAPRKNPVTTSASGTIKKGIEASCWVIESESGETLLPTNLADEFKQDGLKVEFSYNSTAAFSICMQGKAVELKSMRKSP